MKNELCDRLFNFAIRVINFLKTLQDSPEVKIIRYQLIKSSSSSGANYEEAFRVNTEYDLFHIEKYHYIYCDNIRNVKYRI